MHAGWSRNRWPWHLLGDRCVVWQIEPQAPRLFLNSEYTRLFLYLPPSATSSSTPEVFNRIQASKCSEC